MKIKIAQFIIVLILILQSCSKDKVENPGYFAFGDAYGMCPQNCANFFLLKGGKIYPDDMEYYFWNSLKFKSSPLSNDKYDLAKDLIGSLPNYLLQNPNKTFGCPDCLDQGGIHIEIQENNDTIRWHFDTIIQNLPSEIQEYVQQVANTINQLK